MIELEVYSVGGRKVKTLISGYYFRGEYKCSWDGSDSEGNKVNAGIYFYRLNGKEYSETKKMILLK